MQSFETFKFETIRHKFKMIVSVDVRKSSIFREELSDGLMQ